MANKKKPIFVKLTRDTDSPVVRDMRAIFKKSGTPSSEQFVRRGKEWKRLKKAVDQLRKEGGDIKIVRRED